MARPAGGDGDDEGSGAGASASYRACPCSWQGRRGIANTCVQSRTEKAAAQRAGWAGSSVSARSDSREGCAS